MPDRQAHLLPYLALTLNAMVWGLSWWPLRELQSEGLHPLWSSAATYLLGAGAMLCIKPDVWSEFMRHRALWVLALAAGSTMVGFNWGVSIGEVIRVVLLFYLMPIWAVLLARLVLGEAITLKALLRVGLALAGAVLVLSPDGKLGFPVPSGLAEWLGLMGGAAFALNNIMLRHQSQRSSQARLFAMFLGGVVAPLAVATLLAWVLGEGNRFVQWPVVPGGYGLLVLLGFAVTLLVANFGLQYGATRLPANVTSVVMLSEVVFATLSAILLTDETLTLQVGLGGAMILLAAALSALEGGDAH
ncbi:MAG TPA: DMT family transporter [Limnobacter sp.]|nr:DMT family transporter [Limnobacter sp.]